MDELYFLRLLAAVAVFFAAAYAFVKWLNYLSDSKPRLTITYNDEVDFHGEVRDADEVREKIEESRERRGW